MYYTGHSPSRGNLLVATTKRSSGDGAHTLWGRNSGKGSQVSSQKFFCRVPARLQVTPKGFEEVDSLSCAALLQG